MIVTFRGSLSDGKTAASQPVELTLTGQGVGFRRPGDANVEYWPFDQLTAVGPVVKGQPCQIGSDLRPGWLIYVHDTSFAAALLKHAKQLSQGAHDRKILKPMLAVAFVFCAAVFSIWYFDLAVARTVAGFIPDDLRQGLGSKVIQSIAKNEPFCHAPEGRQALDKIVARLKVGEAEDTAFSVNVAKLGIINAFAAPGEQIVVSDRLITFVKSPEELAGIIAHEMGHGLARHPEAGIVRALGISAALEMMFGGSTGQLGDIGALLLQLSYSRQAEAEADDIAIRLLRGAEIRPRPFAQFFERLNKRYGFGSKTKHEKKKTAKKKDDVAASGKDEPSDDLLKTLEVFSSHPPLPDRAKKISSLKAWSSRRLLSDNEWQALRRICQKRSGGSN